MFKPAVTSTTYSVILDKEEATPPKVYITYHALAKMKQYIDQFDKEIGWLGYVDKTEDGYIVSDVFLIGQKVTSVTTELDEDALSEHANKLIREGKLDELQKVKCWGHSHVNMNVTPSGTDDSTFEEYYNNCEFFIRIIGNKKGEMRVDIAEPKRRLKFFNIQFIPLIPQEVSDKKKELDEALAKVQKLNKEIEQYADSFSKSYADSIKKEIELNVKPEVPVTRTYNKWGTNKYKNYSSYYDSYYDDYGYYSNTNDYRYYYNNSDAATAGVIIIYKGTPKEQEAFVTDVLTFNEIYNIYANDTYSVAKKENSSLEEFVNYDRKDWELLVDACTFIVEEFETDDETEKGTA